MNRSTLAYCLVASIFGLFVASCEKKPSIDWNAKENFFFIDKADKNEDGSVRLEYHSLVDAPADGVYQALAEPENYVAFVNGVTDSGKISAEGNTRVVHITQTVIGRQNRAQLKYTFHPEEKKIEFQTLQSDINFNDGSYQVFASPDGKRCHVVSVYNIREKGGQKVPPGVLVSGTREAFKRAAESVKAKALGKNLKIPG